MVVVVVVVGGDGVVVVAAAVVVVGVGVVEAGEPTTGSPGVPAETAEPAGRRSEVSATFTPAATVEVPGPADAGAGERLSAARRAPTSAAAVPAACWEGASARFRASPVMPSAAMTNR